MSAPKQHISLFDKSFNKGNALHYKLYMEISTNGLKQTILDLNTKTFIGFESYQFENIYNEHALAEILKEILTINTLYKLNFKNINVSYVNNRSTLIPNAILDQQKLAEYHKFNFSVSEDDYYIADKLINLSAANIYSIPNFISTLFSDFINVKFNHFSSSLIEAALTDAKANKAISSVYVNVMKESFQVIIIKNQKLALYNSFDYKSNEDFIYYLLFVLDQQGINNEEAIITLTGNITKNDEIYKALYKYINTINFANRNNNITYSYILEETPNHFHHSLFNQFLCE
ncbi:MAG: DUF3822 family protein [Vicingaceae bacterium]|nr:DUF3822 family protein [Vicingaceae bacterium]